MTGARTVIQRTAAAAAAQARRLVPTRIRRLFAGFWAVPLSLAALGLYASIALASLPTERIAFLLGDFDWNDDREGLRQTLGVVATSIMSVVSIVLSLTFVALSLVSQQLSPRMVDFVLRERLVQGMIGLALATFLFATSSLTLGDAQDARRLGIATWTAIGLATLTVIVVVVFVHRMSAVMRPDEMIARRGEALRLALSAETAAPEGSRDAAAPAGTGADLSATFSGYLGVVDGPSLAAWARARELVLSLPHAQGTFVLEGQTIAELIEAPEDFDPSDCADALARELGLSGRPEVASGALYEARALAEGAMKALSAGINDPGTALSCANRLFDAAAQLIGSDPAPTAYADEEGGLRVYVRPVDVPLLMERAVFTMCETGRDVPEFARHCAELLERLARRADEKADRRAAAALREGVDILQG